MTTNRLAVLAFIISVATGVAGPEELQIEKKAGDLDVTAILKQSPSVVGDNDMTVQVKDPSGKAVKDAKVMIHYSMPALPGMLPMNYKTDAMFHGDRYHARMNLSMAGPWNIEVRITRGGKTVSAKFNADAK